MTWAWRTLASCRLFGNALELFCAVRSSHDDIPVARLFCEVFRKDFVIYLTCKQSLHVSHHFRV